MKQKIALLKNKLLKPLRFIMILMLLLSNSLMTLYAQDSISINDNNKRVASTLQEDNSDSQMLPFSDGESDNDKNIDYSLTDSPIEHTLDDNTILQKESEATVEPLTINLLDRVFSHNIFYSLLFIFIVLGCFTLVSFFVILALKKRIQRANLGMVKQHQQLALAITAGNIKVWGYDLIKKKFYSIYGDVFPADVNTLQDLSKYMLKSDLDTLQNMMKSVANGNEITKPALFKLRFPHSSIWHYFEIQLIPVRKDEKEIVSILGTYKNITESYQYQMKLEESRLKTNLAIQVSGMVQWDYDCFSKLFTFLSNEEKNNGGVVSADKYKAYVHPEDLNTADKILDLMNNGLDDKFNYSMRMRFDPKDNWSFFSISGSPLSKDENGKAISYTGFKRDMTDWYKLTNEISRQNEFNSSIIDTIGSGIVYLNCEGIVVWENINEKFGTDFPDLNNLFIKGEDYKRNIHLSKDGEDDILQQLKDTKKSISIDRTIANGSVFEFKFNPNFDEEDIFRGAIIKIEDITERRRLYDELEVSKNRAIGAQKLLADIMDKIPCSIFIKDVNNDFKYIVANQFFCTANKMTKDQIIGKNDSEIYDPLISGNYSRTDEETLRNKCVVVEDKVMFNNKPAFWQTTKSLLETSDGHTLIVGLGVNITDIHNVNNQLMEAKEKAEQSDKIKSAFLANMSHEIRTPLNAIVGFSDMLLKTTDEEEKKMYAGIITNNNELLLRLINDILDLSKIDASAIELYPSEIELSSFIKEISLSAEHRLKDRDIKLELSIPYKSCMVYADRSRLSQVVNNYLSNAIKYTEKGTITLGYELPDDNNIKFFVKDTGRGIASEKKNLVFGRFQKLDQFAQGTGLGLSITKALTELVGGSVGFESEEGVGSLFWAKWPLIPSNIENFEKKLEIPKVTFTEVSKPTEENQKEDPRMIPGLKVDKKLMALVAEDIESNYLLIKQMLRDRCSIIRVENGQEAVNIAKKGGIDLILMDINMPVMNGIEATKEIRKFNQTIPIVAVTANAFDSDRNDAMNAGCTGFITKPINKTSLLDCINKVMDKE